MIRSVFIGPPGSGKGTQADRIEKKCNIKKISTGDILRKAVLENTDYGQKAKTYMDKGLLVPDELILKIVESEIARTDEFILDGFPRNVYQAESLEHMLKKINKSLTHVVYLYVDDNIVKQRLMARRVCPSCGAVYNLLTNPPKDDNKCDVCGAELVRRDDDSEQTISKRLKVYHEQTEPILQFYVKKGILIKVDADMSPSDVFVLLCEKIGLK